MIELLRALLKELLLFLDKLNRAPLRPIQNLHARSWTMSTVTLKWTDATTRTDGSLGVVDHVDVYQAPDDLTPIGTVAGGVQTFTTKDLPPGSYGFRGVEVDAAGIRSAPGNTAMATISPPLTAPLKPISDMAAAVNP